MLSEFVSYPRCRITRSTDAVGGHVRDDGPRYGLSGPSILPVEAEALRESLPLLAVTIADAFEGRLDRRLRLVAVALDRGDRELAERIDLYCRIARRIVEAVGGSASDLVGTDGLLDESP